jgi:flavin-dependent dehydrogenase
MIGGRALETDYGQAVSYGIRRCEFDAYLLRRSQADCRLGQPVKSLVRERDGWLIDGQVHAAMLVGAGGHFCPVARLLGARRQEQASRVVAQEVEFEVDVESLRRGSIEAEVPELYFCGDLAGYGWCFRKGSFLNIGLGRVGGEKLTSHVTAFCDFLRERRKVACRIPEHFHGHAYQLYEGTEPTLVGDRVLLVGDAAGLAYPQSGEGIRPAIESGLMAADAILTAGDYRRGSLESYREAIEARFGSPRSRASAAWLPAGWLAALAARLLASKSFTRRVVLQRWFLHAHEPAFVARGEGVRQSASERLLR